MVLLHGGAPRGAERIAAAWADNRGVTQIVFKPDWTRHGKSAPFKRNDQLLDTLPIGLIVFPGSGITDNLSLTRPARWASRSSTFVRSRPTGMTGFPPTPAPDPPGVGRFLL
jgi:hypothetical protein